MNEPINFTGGDIMLIQVSEWKQHCKEGKQGDITMKIDTQVAYEAQKALMVHLIQNKGSFIQFSSELLQHFGLE